MRRRYLAGVIGQVADVPHRGFHLEILGKKAPDGAGLRRTFNNDQGVTHRPAPYRFHLYRIKRPS